MLLKLLLGSAAVLQLAAGGNLTTDNNMISIIIGGLGGGVNSEVITANSVCSQYTSVPQIPEADFASIFGWSAAVYTEHVQAGEPGDLLLCGGKAIGESDECHSLKLGSDHWKSGGCFLNRERANSAMFSTMDGKVVVSGGYSSKAGWLSDVQMLTSYKSDCDVDCCEWTNIGTINGKGVYSHCALQFDEETFVFIGGNTWDNDGQYDIPDVQRYNTRTGEWTRGKDMTIPRQSHGCIKTTYKGKEGIMVAGGFCNGNLDHPECSQLRIDSTVFYDVINDTWEELAPLNNARDGLTLQNVEGTIMAIGGEYRGTPVNEIEVWNGESWEISELQLLERISNFAFAQIPKDTYHC